MSNSQPAGSRLMQDLRSRVSPGSQSLLSSAYMTPQPAQTVSSDPVGDQSNSDQSLMSAAAPAQVAGQAPDPQAVQDISDLAKIDLFDQVLDEVAEPAPQTPEPSVLSQAVPLAVQQQAQQQAQDQSMQVGGPKKESLDGGSFGVASMELPDGMTYEVEPVPEIPPEVESYMSHVEKAAEIKPDTFVVAEDTVPDASQPAQPPRIVKVLPITKEQEAVGMKKNPTFSVRWLVEFGHKIAKMFAGEVVYRE